MRWPRAIWLLIIGMAIQSTGMSFFWPFTTIYVHSVLHHSVAAAGVILMVQSGASVVGSTVGGRMFDRMGGVVTVSTGIGGAILSLVGLHFVDAFLAYGVLVTAFGLFTGLISPSMYAFSVSVWPQGGRQAFNAIYVAQNLGVAVGSLTAGLVAQAGGLRTTFLVDALLLLVFLIMVLVGYRGPAFQGASRARPEASKRHRPGLPLVGPMLLMAGLVLDWTAYSQWTTTTSTYMHSEGFSLALYSLLWSINGGVILLGQPVISYLTRRWSSVKWQLMVGNLSFLMSYLVLIVTHRYAGYVAAMLLTTWGEMFVWPGVPTRTYQITPEEHVGFYQGLVGGAGSAGRMVGPLVGGFLYQGVSRPMLYTIMTGIFAASSLLYYWHDRLHPGAPFTTPINPPAAKAD
ncbi:MDR family MFS transporter [Sulfobacillus harzensis]|uniref:MFS transporter n=1 Tax=Sulfobacillus harzensis TaxID=2729629 RepID=A0A7Y0L5X4_9FIRM|nr:MFS transporter [Sulfobacillus harzensis]NMP23336.1 MFS transporter [Sulfobacillus harzensis]